MAAFVPDEIVETILLKLPIKSLIRFKTVSKSWYSMISNLRFIRSHYQLSMNSADSDNLFLHSIDDSWFSVIRLEGHEFKIDARVWRPHRWQYGYGTFLCIGDGFVLLDSKKSFDPRDPKTYMLLNPRTRQQTILRFPYYKSTDHSLGMYGVCYDPVNEDVKVLIASKGGFYTVYSCKNSSWAEKKQFPYEIGRRRAHAHGGLSVDGAVYWICYKKDRSKIIVCFDSKYDSFRILRKPEKLKDDQCFQLTARKARLYLCYGRPVKIWVKEKGGCSWKLLVSINNIDNGKIRPRVIAPSTENEMVLFLGEKRYCIYNCCDKSYHEIEVNTTLWKRLHPFVDSMFPIHI